TLLQNIGIGFAVRAARGLHPEIHEPWRDRGQPGGRRVELPDVLEWRAQVRLALVGGQSPPSPRAGKTPADGRRRRKRHAYIRRRRIGKYDPDLQKLQAHLRQRTRTRTPPRRLFGRPVGL